MKPATYSITSTSNPIQLVLTQNQFYVDALTVNRFEWYPTSAYYNPGNDNSNGVPTIYMHGQNVNGKYTPDGTQQDILQVVNRDQNNTFYYQVTYPNPCVIDDALQNLTIYFTDNQGNFINMGQDDPNAVPYYLELCFSFKLPPQ